MLSLTNPVQGNDNSNLSRLMFDLGTNIDDDILTEHGHMPGRIARPRDRLISTLYKTLSALSTMRRVS